MKIVQEKLGRDYFLDLLLTKKEWNLINEYMVISEKIEVNGKEVTVGIKLNLHQQEEKEGIW